MDPRIILVASACIMSLCLQAQNDIMQYIGRSTPQALYVNPAFAPDANTTIGLPGLSSISLRHGNQLFLPKDIFQHTAEGLQFDQESYLAAIGDHNRMSLEFDVDLFSVGHRIGKDFFRFSIRERGEMFVDLPGDLLRFPIVGNGDFDATDGILDFSGLAIGVNQWMEYGIGWQRNLGENTKVGATVKVLFGQHNIRTKRSDVAWTTDQETFEYRFSGGLDINSSGFAAMLDDDEQTEWDAAEKIFGFSNTGFGVDLGVDHRFDDRLSVSASVVDLGFIRWSNEVNNYATSGEEFVFSGLQITEAIIAADSAFSDSLDAAVDQLVEDLERNYDLQEGNGAYSTGIRAKVHLGGEYALLVSPKAIGTAGLLFTSTTWNGNWSPSATVYYRQEVGKSLNARLAYTVKKQGVRGLGAGITVRAGAIQLDLGMENVFALKMARVKTEADSNGFVYPASSRESSVHFGINILLGRPDNDGVLAGRLSK